MIFDSQPCIDASISDLDTQSFLNEYLPQAFDKDTLDENNRSLQDKLASLRFYDPKRNCPTNAGILTFGKNPSFFIPGAYIHMFFGAKTKLEMEMFWIRRKFEEIFFTLCESFNWLLM